MKSNFENLEIFILYEQLADDIWNLVIRWDAFSKRTIGSQLVNAADGVGPNIAEGSGKGSI
jgi:four helix bundle protein